MASYRIARAGAAHYRAAPPSAPSRSPDIYGEDQDEDSIRLAIALQLEDLQASYGVDVQGNDQAAQLDMYRRYLEDTERFLTDRKLAEEIASRNEPVANALPVPTNIEKVVTSPHLQEKTAHVEKSTVTFDIGSDSDAEFKLACELSLRMFEEEKRKTQEPSASSSSAGARLVPEPSPNVSTAPPVPAKTKTCTVCVEEFEPSSLITPPCTHPYCVSCLKKFFTNAIEDESSFPPQCCNLPIPLYLIYRRFSRAEVKKYREKVAEYTSKERIYCANRTCSTFIRLPLKRGSSHISGSAEIVTCRNCKRGTCIRCKGSEHVGDCPEDSELTATLSAAVQNGWQRCRVCRILVEKTDGCDHMSCMCKAEWCYRCGMQWKTCDCGDMEQEAAPARTVEDLIIRQEENQRELERRQEERENQRRAAWGACDHGGKLSENLRRRAKAREKGQKKGKGREEEGPKREETEDDSWWGEEGLWKYKLGESRCDLCSLRLRDYIWQCSGCGLESCMDCRENGV